MPSRSMAWLVVLVGFQALLAAACGSRDGNVELLWQAENGRPLAVDITDSSARYDTVIYVDNDSGATLRGAVLRFSPSEAKDAPVGFSVVTATTVRTDFDGPAHLWQLGDIAANTRLAFPLSLWFSAAGQLDSAAALDLVITLESDNLTEAINGVITVQFERRGAVVP